MHVQYYKVATGMCVGTVTVLDSMPAKPSN